MNDDIIMSEPVGKYDGLEGVKLPYYARRWHCLPGPGLGKLYPDGAWADQILIMSNGRMTWINLAVQNGKPTPAMTVF